MSSWAEEMEYDAVEFAVRDYAISSNFLMETLSHTETVPESITRAIVALASAIDEEWGVDSGRTG